MQQYSDLLTQRLQQRQAMRAAEAVPLANGRARQQEDSDSDFGDDEAAAPQRQQKAGKAAKRQRASTDQQVWYFLTLRKPTTLQHWLYVGHRHNVNLKSGHVFGDVMPPG